MNEHKSFSSHTPKIVGGISIGMISLIAMYLLVLKPMEASSNKNTAAATDSAPSTTQSPSIPTTPTAPTTPTTPTNPSTYKAGSYSATAHYSVPHGESNSITVSATVSTDGAISDVTTKHQYSDRESSYYIESFDSLVQSSVVGKNIENISVGRIGGASLTSGAFSKALTQISTDAHA